MILRLCVPLFVLGIAGGSIVTPNQTLTLADVDPSRGGVAGGVVQTAQRVGASIGQTVLGTSFVVVLAGTPRLGAGRPRPRPGRLRGGPHRGPGGVRRVLGDGGRSLSGIEIRRSRAR